MIVKEILYILSFFVFAIGFCILLMLSSIVVSLVLISVSPYLFLAIVFLGTFGSGIVFFVLENDDELNKKAEELNKKKRVQKKARVDGENE